MSPDAPLTFRRARPEEAATLTELALRSKRHWGYDDAFMSLARAGMEITPESVASSVTVEAEREGILVGFYLLLVEPEGPTLREMWVEPAAIRSGVGARLWEHMLGEARAAGYRVVKLVSDPNAAGFYRRMGAHQIGEVPSVGIPGRMLPAFEIVPG